MNDIARLGYEKQLPDKIDGNLHHTIIHKYQLWKGIHRVPAQTHEALKWSPNDPMQLVPAIDYPSILDKGKHQQNGKNVIKAYDFIDANKKSLELDI